MRQPNQRGPSRNTSPHRTPLAAWVPLIAALAIMITGCLGTLLVLQLDEFRPQVGDIISFKPESQDRDVWLKAIPATLVPATGSPIAKCSLDPNVMADKGGSLIVEGRRNEAALQYIVHWAGSETARSGGNCGNSANLLVSRADLQRLANSAGGFGVGAKGTIR